MKETQKETRDTKMKQTKKTREKRVRITNKEVVLPFVPTEDIPGGLRMVLSRYWRIEETEMPRMTCDIIKGQDRYALPPNMKERKQNNIWIESIWIKLVP